MSQAKDRLVKRLESEGEKTLAFFQAIGDDSWTLTVYTEGARWTVTQVLSHFVNTESGISRLISHIVEGGPGVAEDFDLDDYNERKVKEHISKAPIELLREFADLRAKTVHLVREMTDADLDKRGRHPFLGIATVEDIVKLMYRHTQIHQRDLKRLFKSAPTDT